MMRIVKYVIYLIVLGIIGLVAYAYIGPFLGADFTPDPQNIRESVVLDAT